MPQVAIVALRVFWDCVISATPEYIIAAIYAAKVAFETAQDPARALQYIALDGIIPTSAEKRFSDTERNILIGKGNFNGSSTK